MPYKTILNEDILNIIFDFAGLDCEYKYYKRKKEASMGFRDLKINYKCNKCNKNIRKLNKSSFGFIINYYDYYATDNTKSYYRPRNVCSFYHSKYKINEELVKILENVIGDVIENRYEYIIKMQSELNNKIIGKLIILGLNNINHIYDKFLKDLKKMKRYGILIELQMMTKNEYIKMLKEELIIKNEDNIDVGYYCTLCSKNTSYYNFIKL